jgi:phosphoglycolate phosphatase-like HAD superfamily hydrolase
MDVDGVLLDLVPNVQQYVLENYGAHITENHITAWDWDYCLGVPLTRNEEFWYYVWTTEPLKPYPGAIDFIRLLRTMGYRVIAVSNRASKTAKAAAERDFGMFAFNYKILVDDSKDKVKYAHEIEASYSLEDSPKNAVALGEGKKDLKSFLLTRPWNKYTVSLTHAYKRINEMNNKADQYRVFINHLVDDVMEGVKDATAQ